MLAHVQHLPGVVGFSQLRFEARALVNVSFVSGLATQEHSSHSNLKVIGFPQFGPGDAVWRTTASLMVAATAVRSLA